VRWKAAGVRAPVLLGVRLPAGEIDRLAADDRRAADRRGEQMRVPVLAEAGDEMGRARSSEQRAARRPGRGEADVESGVRPEVGGQPAAVGGQRAGLAARPHTERGAIVTGARQIGSAQKSSRMGRQRDRRPRVRGVGGDAGFVGGAAHPTQRNDHPPRTHVGEPPEVPLHRDAVGAARIAERRIGAARPVASQHRVSMPDRGQQGLDPGEERRR
jgi:hypothetical protein